MKWQLVASGMALVVTAIGCGGESVAERHPAIINVGIVGDTLGIGLDSCTQTPVKIATRETSTAVHLRVTSTWKVGGDTPNCKDAVRIDLAKPLGRRSVIDDATGHVLPIVRSRG